MRYDNYMIPCLLYCCLKVLAIVSALFIVMRYGKIRWAKFNSGEVGSDMVS